MDAEQLAHDLSLAEENNHLLEQHVAKLEAENAVLKEQLAKQREQSAPAAWADFDKHMLVTPREHEEYGYGNTPLYRHPQPLPSALAAEYTAAIRARKEPTKA